MTRVQLRPVLAESIAVLEAAGVPSPRVDAEQLAAHVLGVERSRLLLNPLIGKSVVVYATKPAEEQVARVAA